ncbi:hypothetical protein F8388_024029 [Cannabis sativa]|uniref:Uncharacterized protein n=1 Tax=Cannabis sativa TaxID=3483 RepID=A0A7J6FX65_CANSA|nr:hypothetical protein G4B88_022012 [Cannabis sativa]KAF4375370.1 hypothetical protein F8388_024029 [Cannabis sativa]
MPIFLNTRYNFRYIKAQSYSEVEMCMTNYSKFLSDRGQWVLNMMRLKSQESMGSGEEALAIGQSHGTSTAIEASLFELLEKDRRSNFFAGTMLGTRKPIVIDVCKERTKIVENKEWREELKGSRKALVLLDGLACNETPSPLQGLWCCFGPKHFKHTLITAMGFRFASLVHAKQLIQRPFSSTKVILLIVKRLSEKQVRRRPLHCRES